MNFIDAVNDLNQEILIEEYDIYMSEMVPETSQDYYYKGAYYLEQDKYEDALYCFMQGLEDKEDEDSQFNSSFGVLLTLLYLERNKEAEEWYKEILKLLDEKNCSHTKLEIHLKIGYAYLSQNNYLKTLKEFVLATESLKRVFLSGALINDSYIVIDADEEYPMDMFFALDYIDSILEGVKKLSNIPDTPENHKLKEKIYSYLKFIILRMEKVFTNELIKGEEQYTKEVLKNKILEHKKEISENPDDIFSYFNMAQIYTSLDMFKEQDICYESILKIDPNNFYGLFGKGTLLVDFGLYEEAIECFDKLIEIKPDCEDGWWCKGGALIELGKNLEAIKCFEEALRLEPDCFEATNGMGWAYKALNKITEALRWFDKALTMNEDSSEIWNVKGAILSSLDRKIEALECYDKALQIEPKDVFILNNKNGVLIELGRYKEAEECIQQIIKINPEHAPAYYNKACLRILTNEKSDALTNLKKAVELDSRLKEYAKKDKDFNSIKDDKDFQNLLK